MIVCHMIFLSQSLRLMAFTAQNTEILPNFLVWKFCGKAVSVEFWVIRPKLCANSAFPQNLRSRKLGETSVFHAMRCELFLILNCVIGSSLKQIPFQ